MLYILFIHFMINYLFIIIMMTIKVLLLDSFNLLHFNIMFTNMIHYYLIKLFNLLFIMMTYLSFINFVDLLINSKMNLFMIMLFTFIIIML